VAGLYIIQRSLFNPGTEFRCTPVRLREEEMIRGPRRALSRVRLLETRVTALLRRLSPVYLVQYFQGHPRNCRSYVRSYLRS
jgi:hypothetical protein